MPFEHACFVSYRHHEKSLLAERFVNDFCLALRSELTMLVEHDLFVDRERMGGGNFFNPALARALCRSVCMIVIYTPTYFSTRHPYCAREYRAMEALEETRLSRVAQPVSAERGLIVPLVLRGESLLPASIRSSRQYYTFERFSLSSQPLPRNRTLEALIRQIANDVHACWQMLRSVEDDVTSLCDRFRFPTEQDIQPWLSTMVSPEPPFPFRAG